MNILQRFIGTKIEKPILKIDKVFERVFSLTLLMLKNIIIILLINRSLY